MSFKSVSLKVCEGCGTLWFRAAGGHGVYCGPCTTLFSEFPDPKTRRRPGRPKKQRGATMPGPSADAVVCGLEFVCGGVL